MNSSYLVFSTEGIISWTINSYITVSVSHDNQTLSFLLLCHNSEIMEPSDPKVYFIFFWHYFETPCKISEQTVERLPRKTWTNTQTNMEKYNKDINFLRELLKRKAVLHVSNLFRKQRHTLFGTFIFNLQVFEGSYTRVAEHFIRSMKLTTLLHMTMFAYLPL